MTTDWKALCAELVNSWTEGLNIVGPMHHARALLDQPETPSRLHHCPTHGQQPDNAWGCPECVREMRQQLAHHEPEGPTDEEILNLFWKHSSEFGYIGVGVTDEDAPALIREALARWGRPAIEPETNGQA